MPGHASLSFAKPTFFNISRLLNACSTYRCRTGFTWLGSQAGYSLDSSFFGINCQQNTASIDSLLSLFSTSGSDRTSLLGRAWTSPTLARWTAILFVYATFHSYTTQQVDRKWKCVSNTASTQYTQHSVWVRKAKVSWECRIENTRNTVNV